MIALAFIIVTDLEEIPTADIIEFQYGTEEFGFGGDMIRDFIKSIRSCTRKSSEMTEDEVVTEFLEHCIPPSFRAIFEMTYYELKDIII